MASSTRRFGTFDGLTISYASLGDPGAPVVVLLHGFASDGYGNWIDTGIAPAVAAAGFRVLVPDARGHGRSSTPHDVEAYLPPAMARDVIALLDHEEVEMCALVGYSMGSTTAITAAALAPVRVARVVLGGTGSALLHADDGDVRARRLLGARVLELDDASGVTDPAGRGLRAFVEANGGDRVALAAVLRAEAGIGDDERTITTPALILTGDDDRGAGDPDVLARLLPNARVERLRGDHLGAPRDPTFAERIARFVSVHRGGEGAPGGPSGG